MGAVDKAVCCGGPNTHTVSAFNRSLISASTVDRFGKNLPR